MCLWHKLWPVSFCFLLCKPPKEASVEGLTAAPRLLFLDYYCSSTTTVCGCQFPQCWVHHQLACGRRSIKVRFRLPSMAENARYLISSQLSALSPQIFRENDVVAETRASLFGGGSIFCILPRTLTTMTAVSAIRLTDLHAFLTDCTTHREIKSER